MNGQRWAGIIGAMIGALIVLCIWVLNEVKAFRETAQASQIADVETKGLVEKRYLELIGKINKQTERLDTQKETDDIMVDQVIKLLNMSHSHDPGPVPRVPTE